MVRLMHKAVSARFRSRQSRFRHPISTALQRWAEPPASIQSTSINRTVSAPGDPLTLPRGKHDFHNIQQEDRVRWSIVFRFQACPAAIASGR